MAEDDGVLVTLRDWIYLHVHAKFPRGRFWLPHLKEYETFYVDAMREARIWSEALIDRARHGAPHDQ